MRNPCGMNRSQVPATAREEQRPSVQQPAMTGLWPTAWGRWEVTHSPAQLLEELVRDPEAREPSKPVSGHLVHQDSETINTYCFFPLSFIEENMTNKQLYAFKAYNVMFSYTCILWDESWSQWTDLPPHLVMILFIYLKTLLFIYFLKKDHERVGGVGEEGDREIIPCGLHAQRGSVLEWSLAVYSGEG